MPGCCCGCNSFRPRYKRLVDDIFPINAEDGLVKNNMDKLTFYALKSPDKLDKIACYLAERLSQEIKRGRYGFVILAMNALDSLLLSCHAQSLNLFVESFLKMVQKLLECPQADLQCRATESFVKFANIEEDTPSYHRRYDFFVCKFSEMCHCHLDETNIRYKLRLSGLRGLQGVVRKTGSDDLQTNIWDKQHMDKIVPSLLFNINHKYETHVLSGDEDEEKLETVAGDVFRDLVCRVSYGNINDVLEPVLMHFDNHNLWLPNNFAIDCFKMIMYSVQSQYGYGVVQVLMEHLDRMTDAKIKNLSKIKTSIVNVLSETVMIAAKGVCGPSVLQVFNTLIRHLGISVQKDASKITSSERNFQEAIISTIRDFANKLPDYHKIDVMCFIIQKIPQEQKKSQDILLQTMLMKTILKIATHYKTILLSNAYSPTFLEYILAMSVVSDSGVRRLVHETMHVLTDRQDNLSKLTTVRCPKEFEDLKLSISPVKRQDVLFSKKLTSIITTITPKQNASLIYWYFNQSVMLKTNKVDNFESLYTTMTLFYIEMANDELFLDSIRLALSIQSWAMENVTSIPHKCAFHALVASYLKLVISSSPEFADQFLVQHIEEVINRREESAPFLLPEIAFHRQHAQMQDTPKDMSKLLFDGVIIGETLKSSGKDISQLFKPYKKQILTNLDTVDLRKSISESHSISNISLNFSSRASSLESIYLKEDTTFEGMKKVLDSPAIGKDLELIERNKVLKNFKRSFKDIVHQVEKEASINEKMIEILNTIPMAPTMSYQSELDRLTATDTINQFPSGFIY